MTAKDAQAAMHASMDLDKGSKTAGNLKLSMIKAIAGYHDIKTGPNKNWHARWRRSSPSRTSRCRSKRLAAAMSSRLPGPVK